MQDDWTGADTVVQLPPPGTYRVDPSWSAVRYIGRHVFGLGAVQATFAVAAGAIEVAEPTSASEVRLSVDPATFTSDKTRRDKHVKSKVLLDVEQYPEISFRSTSVRADGDHWRVIGGDVTAHGSTQPVEITVDRATASGTDVTVHAVAQLDRYAFGVTGVKGMAARTYPSSSISSPRRRRRLPAARSGIEGPQYPVTGYPDLWLPPSITAKASLPLPQRRPHRGWRSRRLRSRGAGPRVQASPLPTGRTVGLFVRGPRTPAGLSRLTLLAVLTHIAQLDRVWRGTVLLERRSEIH